jgi:hypothetical protein
MFGGGFSRDLRPTCSTCLRLIAEMCLISTSRNLNKGSRPSERRFLLVLLVRNRHPGGIILPKWTRSDKRVSSRFNSFRNIMLPRSFSVAFCPDFSDSCTVAVCSYPHQSALGLGGLGLSTFLSTLSLPWRVFCKLRNRRLISLRLIELLVQRF